MTLDRSNPPPAVAPRARAGATCALASGLLVLCTSCSSSGGDEVPPRSDAARADAAARVDAREASLMDRAPVDSARPPDAGGPPREGGARADAADATRADAPSPIDGQAESEAAADAAAPGADCSGYPTILGDDQPFPAAGPYTAPYLSFLAPFGKGSWVNGVNYTECLGLTPETFPNDQRIAWSWPEVPANGVYNFLAVDFGDYDDSPTSVTSQTVSSISTLTQAYDFSFAGELDNFDVIIDLFLTKAAGNNGDRSLMAHEIEVGLHSPPYFVSYAESVQQLGSFTASGLTWTVSVDTSASPPDVLLQPSTRADVPSGTLDVRALLQSLVTLGAIGGGEYFNGLGVGVEVHQGSGTLDIHTLSLTYH